MYRRLFERKAKDEADYLCQTYGQAFAEAFNQWLEELIQASEKGFGDESIDLAEAMEQLDGEIVTDLQTSWKLFTGADWKVKMRMLLATLRKRCPPLQARQSSRNFMLLGSIPVEIQTYYSVDHAERCVVFRKFEW